MRIAFKKAAEENIKYIKDNRSEFIDGAWQLAGKVSKQIDICLNLNKQEQYLVQRFDLRK